MGHDVNAPIPKKPRVELARMADELDAIERQGTEKDEPKGSRYIVLSDTVAKQISAAMRGQFSE